MMTIGENKLKYIAFVLMILVFFAFSCQNLFAQETTFSPPASLDEALRAGPPGPEQVKSFWNNITGTTKSIFQNINIKKIGKGFSYLTPFFQNISEKIGTWWSIQARSWIFIQWNCLSNYLEQEIKIE